MAALAAWDEGVARDIIARHVHLEGSLLPILHAIQAEFGHVPEPAIPIVATVLNLSRAEVYGVVTFYHDFRQVPAGRHVLKLCRAEACQAMGGERLVEHAEDRLGVRCGNTSADRRVTLEPIYCLGLCATAPAAMLDGRIIGRLTATKLDGLLAEVGA